MKVLPTGTVTFLFSDIEGNTPLWERDPEKMEAAMQIHHAILRRAIEDDGGVVFKIIGDEFQAAFPTAPQALRAALEAQRRLQEAAWNELGPLRVRMGMHTGEAHPDAEGDEYAVSHTKNRGHRVMEAGHGGQILLSQESADLCWRELPEGIYLKDLGEHYIRSLKLPEHFYQVVALDLPKDFPPLRTQVEPKHNLPVQLTSFVGREEEIEQVGHLLNKSRLVTISGTGGVGKTRLALQTAEGLLDQYPDGAWLANLALISDPEQLAPTVGRAVGMYIDSEEQAQEKLVDYLRERQLLLVLDNCEHLIEACAHLAEALLQACRKVKILATSRERLGVMGEQDFYLPSLSLPDMAGQPELERIAESEAVRLFVERAAGYQPGFSLTEQNAQAVGRICAQLDGIPLAVELAAPWVRSLPVEQISRRLKESLDYLRGAARTALPRHQTLRGCLDWSYALLTQAEQDLLQALSVFVGGWTLEAAEAVCGGSCTEDQDIFDLLDHLVSKSLVVAEQDEERGLRYRLLEPVRQYAQEKLYRSGRLDELRGRHLVYYQELAAQAAPHLRTHEQIAWQRRLERELPNLRLALEWACSEDGPMERLERGLRMGADLRFYWQGHTRFEEGVLWLRRLLDLEQLRRGDQPLMGAMRAVRANALLEMVSLNRFVVARFDLEPYYAEECRALFSQMGEAGRGGLARLRFFEVSASLQERLSLLNELLPEFEALGDRFMQAECLFYMGICGRILGNYQHGEQCMLRSLQISLETGDWDILPSQKSILGILAFHQGHLERAREWAEQARQSLEEVEADLPWSAAIAYDYLGILAFLLGDYAQAEANYRKTITLFMRCGMSHYGFKGELAFVWLAQGNYLAARALLNELLNILRKNDSVFLTILLGDLEWGTGRYAQAGKIFTEILQSTNLYAFYKLCALWGLARIALSKQDWDGAVQQLAQALDLQSQDPSLFFGYEDNYGGVVLTAILALSRGDPSVAPGSLGRHTLPISGTGRRSRSTGGSSSRVRWRRPAPPSLSRILPEPGWRARRWICNKPSSMPGRW